MEYLRSLDNQRTLSTDFEGGPKSMSFMIKGVFYYLSILWIFYLINDITVYLWFILSFLVSLGNFRGLQVPWQHSRAPHIYNLKIKKEGNFPQ